MPGTPWPIFRWVRELRVFSRRFASAPVYAAVLLVMAAVLTSVVAGELRQSSRQGASPQAVCSQQTGPPVEPAPPVLITDSNAAPAGAIRPVEPGCAAGPCRPVAGAVVLDFGWQEQPVLRDWRYHVGIDLEAAPDTPVRALYGGEVTKMYTDKDYGLTVVIAGGENTVYYGALAGSDLAVGRRVAAGEKVGTAGTSALEPYNHLHLAVKVGNKYVNPREVLAEAQ